MYLQPCLFACSRGRGAHVPALACVNCLAGSCSCSRPFARQPVRGGCGQRRNHTNRFGGSLFWPGATIRGRFDALGGRGVYSGPRARSLALCRSARSIEGWPSPPSSFAPAPTLGRRALSPSSRPKPPKWGGKLVLDVMLGTAPAEVFLQRRDQFRPRAGCELLGRRAALPQARC